MKSVSEKIKKFFVYKNLTILPLIGLTLILFILNKILHVDWYISIIIAILFAVIGPKLINPNWELKLLKFNLFQKYLNFMLICESMFVSSSIAQFSTGMYLFIIFEVLHQSTNALISFLFFFLFFLFLLYLRLRSQIFSINELAYDVINEISPLQLKNHFFKLVGVQLNLHFKYNYYLVGLPKRNMFSMRELGTTVIKYAGRITGSATVGAVVSYAAYHSDQEASQHNKLSHEQIRRLTERHDVLTEQYYQRFTVNTPESDNIKKLLEDSASKLDTLNTFAKRSDIVGVRIFTKPIPTNPEYLNLKSEALQSLAVLQSRIDPSSPIEIQKTGFFDVFDLISKSTFI